MSGFVPIFDDALVAWRRDRALARAVRNPDAAFLFDEICARLGERLDVVRRDFAQILDFGCAAGTMTQILRGRSGVVQVLPVDSTPRAAGVETVCDVSAPPFAPESFDAVISAMTLHWVNDLPGVLVQLRRALRPDGLFLAAMAGGETLFELRHALMQAEEEVTGGASPRVSPFADVRDMGGLMQRAGFALPVVDCDRIVVDYPHMFRLMEDLRAMGAANATLNRLKTPTRRKVFLEAARIYQEKFGRKDGAIPATFDILFLTGWAPHDSQQKPLKPGTAKQSLIDALS